MKSIILKIAIPIFVIIGCSSTRHTNSSHQSSDKRQDFEHLINSSWDPKLIPALTVSVVTSEGIIAIYTNGIRKIGTKDSTSKEDY